MAVSSSEHKSLLSGFEGIVVADTEPTAFPAKHIREAARTSVSKYLFRINPRGGEMAAPMHEDYCF